MVVMQEEAEEAGKKALTGLNYSPFCVATETSTDLCQGNAPSRMLNLPLFRSIDECSTARRIPK